MKECSPPPQNVMCHVSRVMCQVSHVTFIYFIFFFGQSGEAYRLRVCYQRGLPRLVFMIGDKFKTMSQRTVGAIGYLCQVALAHIHTDSQ